VEDRARVGEKEIRSHQTACWGQDGPVLAWLGGPLRPVASCQDPGGAVGLLCRPPLALKDLGSVRSGEEDEDEDEDEGEVRTRGRGPLGDGRASHGREFEGG
jgi:hypothetical protein